MKTRAIREKLKRGVSLGSWITLADCSVAEIMASAGFDWLAVDMEHSAITLDKAAELIRVISLRGVCPLVRLSANDPVLAKRVMDAGASGVIVPMVNTREEALEAVAAVKYPPAGRRSFGLARAQGYGTSFREYVSTANADSLVIVQAEHVLAFSNLDSILSVPGVDAFLIGPYDLSGSLGIPGRLSDPKVRGATAKALEISRARGVPAGIHVVEPSAEDALARVEAGFRLIAFGVDFLFLGNSCRRGLQEIASGLRRRRGKRNGARRRGNHARKDRS